MSEKTVIVGATGGIGEAVARSLSARGQDIHLVARDNNQLAPLAAELGSPSSHGDVTDPDFFSRLADEVEGPVTGLVYAVGTINLKSMARLTADDFARDLQVNAVGAALTVKALLPALRKGGAGSIVFYSSIAAHRGFSMHGSIGMAKGAVNGLTLSLAAELAPRIRVNAVAPSLMDTPLASRMLSNAKLVETMRGTHPLQRLGTVEDAANLTLFLLSEQSSWMTGQILGLDGGRSTLQAQ